MNFNIIVYTVAEKIPVRAGRINVCAGLFFLENTYHTAAAGIARKRNAYMSWSVSLFPGFYNN
jgi:hypothetical protein